MLSPRSTIDAEAIQSIQAKSLKPSQSQQADRPHLQEAAGEAPLPSPQKGEAPPPALIVERALGMRIRGLGTATAAEEVTGDAAEVKAAVLQAEALARANRPHESASWFPSWASAPRPSNEQLFYGEAPPPNDLERALGMRIRSSKLGTGKAAAEVFGDAAEVKAAVLQAEALAKASREAGREAVREAGRPSWSMPSTARRQAPGEALEAERLQAPPPLLIERALGMRIRGMGTAAEAEEAEEARREQTKREEERQGPSKGPASPAREDEVIEMGASFSAQGPSRGSKEPAREREHEAIETISIS